MKKSTSIILIVVALVLVCCVWIAKGYNGLVAAEETVNNAWAQVENQYQRRSDLIPNLVETVKGYAKHESTTLEEVVAARAKATSVTVGDNLSEADIKKFAAAQSEVGSSLSRLLAVVENYPDLKANENFLRLQEQLEGTENRITVARNEYNNQAKVYNTTVRTFPKSIIAGIFGFEKKGYFEAEAGAEKAPKVQF